MLITLLVVPDCPNAPALLGDLHARFAGPGDNVAVVVIDDDERARRWGMTGSPTVLLDGLDPFPTAGVEPSVSCRIYRGADGTMGGAPSLADLEAAVQAAPHRPRVNSGHAGIASIDRAGRGRLAPAQGGLRAVQQALVRAMAESGNLPLAEDLDRVAGGFGRSERDVLNELAAEDYLTLDHHGRPRAIYPFSAVPSRHRVTIADGSETWAMCAVDALGIAPMLRRAVTIETSDPLTTDLIRVDTSPGQPLTATPPDAVVFVGQRDDTGPAERRCCDLINLFGSCHSATRWAATHPDVHGQLMDLHDAAALGRTVFGELLEH